MNTNQFRSSFTQRGIPARNNKFDLRILALPEAVATYSEYKDIVYRCRETTLPGRNINTTEFSAYGPPKKIAYGAAYENQSLTIIVSDDMFEKTLFDRWQSYITNDETGSDVKYHDSYVGKVQVTQYNNTGEIATKTVEFIDAFPVVVSPMRVAWDANDEYHVLEIELAYTKWRTIENTGSASPSNNTTPTSEQQLF